MVVDQNQEEVKVEQNALMASAENNQQEENLQAREESKAVHGQA